MKDDQPPRPPLRWRKPFVLLAALDRKEIQNFRLFLNFSPLAGRLDERLLEFFDLCATVELWNTDLSKPSFQRKVKTEWTDNNFDKLVSRLYTQLTAFVSHLELARDTAQQQISAIKFYQSRQISPEELEKKWNEVKRELEDMLEDETYFRSELEVDLLITEATASRSQSPEDNAFANLHSHLDQYYWILKLRFMCASANQSRIFGKTDNPELLSSLLDWFRVAYPQMSLLARAYYHAYHLLTDSDELDHDTLLKELLQEWEAHLKAFKKEEEKTALGELYGYLRNHYIHRLNLGDIDVQPDLLQTQLEGIRLGWTLKEGKLKPETYKNIILLFCHLDRLKEARTFFTEWGPLLTNDHDGAAIAYNEAVIKLHEKRYPEALAELATLMDATGSIRTDPYYGLDIRCHLLKGYFLYLGHADFDTWDIVDKKFNDLIRSFPEYVKRKNLPMIKYARYENFRNGFRDLFNAQYVAIGEERLLKLKELLKEIRSSSNLPDKPWFVHTIESLLKTRDQRG